VVTAGAAKLKIAKVRLNCIEAWEEPVHVKVIIAAVIS